MGNTLDERDVQDSEVLPENKKHPIPAGSVITEDMIRVAMNYFNANRDVVIGILADWEHARGSMDSRLVDLDIANGSTLFAPLREAFYRNQASNGNVNLPPLALTRETATDEEQRRLSQARAGLVDPSVAGSQPGVEEIARKHQIDQVGENSTQVTKESEGEGLHAGTVDPANVTRPDGDAHLHPTTQAADVNGPEGSRGPGEPADSNM